MRFEKSEEVVGYKVGCTSQTIRSQFGLQEPISGRLFSPYIFNEGTQLDWGDYVNCSIEPEMVLKIGKDLTQEKPSNQQLIDAIEYVSPEIEIHNFKPDWRWCRLKRLPLRKQFMKGGYLISKSISNRRTVGSSPCIQWWTSTAELA